MRKKSLFIVMVALMCVCLFQKSSAAAYQRIVSLSPAITEILFALGLEDSIVGVTSFCDYPPEAQQKEKVGGFINPHIEKIVALEPDIVVISPNSATAEIKRKLDSFNIKTLVVDFYGLDNLQEAYLQLGAFFDCTVRAAELIAELTTTIEGIPHVSDDTDKKKVIFVRSHVPLIVAAQGTFEDDIIKASGAVNGITTEGMRYPHYSIEEILKIDPDIIIDATYYDSPSEYQLDEIKNFWHIFSTLKAVAEERVYIIESDIHSVPGPRTPAFIQIMASIVHPQSIPSDKDAFRKISF